MVQKAGRKASISVVQAIGNVPDSARAGALMEAIMENQNDLGPYLQVVGISGALREAGANEQLIAWTIETIDASGLIPASVPR
jgi:hypothetical protein